MVLPLSIQSTLQKTYYVVTNQHLLCCIEHISSSGALVHCIEEVQLVLLSYLNYLVQEMTPDIYTSVPQDWGTPSLAVSRQESRSYPLTTS